jgi:predicted nucleic acid-binding protein
VIIPDANLLLYASDSSSPFHRAATAWWSGCLSGNETVGLVPVVLLAALGIRHRAVIHTADADFARFPGVKWFNPITGRRG